MTHLPQDSALRRTVLRLLSYLLESLSALPLQPSFSLRLYVYGPSRNGDIALQVGIPGF